MHTCTSVGPAPQLLGHCHDLLLQNEAWGRRGWKASSWRYCQDPAPAGGMQGTEQLCPAPRIPGCSKWLYHHLHLQGHAGPELGRGGCHRCSSCTSLPRGPGSTSGVPSIVVGGLFPSWVGGQGLSPLLPRPCWAPGLDPTSIVRSFSFIRPLTFALSAHLLGALGLRTCVLAGGPWALSLGRQEAAGARRPRPFSPHWGKRRLGLVLAAELGHSQLLFLPRFLQLLQNVWKEVPTPAPFLSQSGRAWSGALCRHRAAVPGHRQRLHAAWLPIHAARGQG